MNDFFLNLSHEVYVFLLAAVPLIELRGAIPLGIGLGMSPWEAYWISVAGSTLPAPFLILFFRKILEFMEEKNIFKWFTDFLNNHIYKKSKKLKAANILGIYVFVAIPLPSTGAYTGSALASILNIRMKYALPAIFFGNMTAGFIMMMLSHAIML